MPRVVLFTACVLALATVSNSNSFGLVFARAAEGLGIEVAALGGLRTIENAASIVAAIIAAPLIDRFPRKRLLMAGFATATVAVLILVVSNSVQGVIAYYALNGAAMVLVFGALMAMPGDFARGRQLNRIMGLIIGCIAFTSVFVAPVVGNVADAFGWRAGMLVSSIVTSSAFLLAFALIPSYSVQASAGATEGFIDRYRAAFERRPLVILLGSNLLRFSQLGAMLAFLSTILIQRYGLSLSVIGFLFSAVGIAFFLSSLISGYLLHWLKTWRVLVWGGCAVVALLAVMLIYHPPLSVMIPATMLFIIVIAAQENTATIAALRLAGDARGAAMSWNELAAGLGSLLGIGSCSIGLAIGGVQGLGIALTSIAVVATASSVFALWYADYRDDPEELQPVSV